MGRGPRLGLRYTVRAPAVRQQQYLVKLTSRMVREPWRPRQRQEQGKLRKRVYRPYRIQTTLSLSQNMNIISTIPDILWSQAFYP